MTISPRPGLLRSSPMAGRKARGKDGPAAPTPLPAHGSGPDDLDETRPRFVDEEAAAIVKEAMRVTLENRHFQEKKLKEWMSEVTERTLSELARLAKPFKYVVTCLITQKSGAGLHMSNAFRWHPSTDGTCTVKWENESMYCAVIVDGLHA